MLNRVVLVGRLTKDPELKVSQSNISVVNFTLAVNRPFTDANGERGADFINIVTFRKQAENVNQYLKKGSLAGVDGRLQSRSYENKEGQRVYVTEVVADSVQFLEPKGSNGSGGNHPNKMKEALQAAPTATRAGDRTSRTATPMHTVDKTSSENRTHSRMMGRWISVMMICRSKKGVSICRATKDTTG